MKVNDMMAKGEALANETLAWMESEGVSHPAEVLSVVTAAERMLRKHLVANPHTARTIISAAHATYEAMTQRQEKH